MEETKHIIGQERKDLFPWFRRFGEQFDIGFLIIEPTADTFPISYANEAFLSLTGFEMADLIDKPFNSYSGPLTDEHYHEELKRHLMEETSYHTEMMKYKQDGSPFWTEMVVEPLKDANGEILFFVAFVFDRTDRKRNEAILKMQEMIHTQIEKGYTLTVILQEICDTIELFFNQEIHSSILLVDEEQKLRFAAAKSLPVEFVREVDGLEIGVNNGICGTSALARKPIISEEIEKDEMWDFKRNLIRRTKFQSGWSVPIINGDQELLGTFAFYSSKKMKPTEDDIHFINQAALLVSLALKYSKNQQEILRLAYIDTDTGLHNRHYFMSELRDILSERKEGFVVIIESYEYRQISDIYGRAAGDELISQMANRIKKSFDGYDDVVARFSNSAIILAGYSPKKEEDLRLPNLMKIAREPYFINNEKVYTTVKIGVTLFNKNNQDAEELIRFADMALSISKRSPGNAIEFFRSEHDEEAKRDMSIFNQITSALQNEEFEVYLQPKVQLDTREIISLEALARWKSPKLGFVPPDVFIPMAENLGRICELDMLLLKKVLMWHQERKAKGLRLYQVAVNISTAHFFEERFVNEVLGLIKTSGIDPEYIRLELTESIGVVDFEVAKEKFKTLKEAGVESSIDDFGVGFSSLSYLHQLPVTELKIDRSFMFNINDPGNAATVRTIIQLSNNLDMVAIAEGIEEEEQIAILQAMGCKFGQGFYFYRPMDLDSANKLLE